MKRLIHDILPPTLRPRVGEVWSRHSGKIKIGALVIFVAAALLSAGYFYVLPILHERGIFSITSIPEPKEAQAAVTGNPSP